MRLAMKYGRLTARQAHERGYVPARVLLDGVEVRPVAVMDDVEGWVDVYETDEDGHVIAFPVEGTDDLDAKVRRLYGEVTYIPAGRDEQDG